MGTIIPRLTDRFTSTSEASKYLYCDGSTFNISKYPKLYTILGTNQLPDLRGKFLQGNDIGGTFIEAGLPNITGTFNQGANLHNMSSRRTVGSFYCLGTEYPVGDAQTIMGTGKLYMLLMPKEEENIGINKHTAIYRPIQFWEIL